MAPLSVPTAAFIMEIQQGPGGAQRLCRAGAGEQGQTACGCRSLAPPGPPASPKEEEWAHSAPWGRAGTESPHLPPRKLFLGFLRLQLGQ